MFNFDLFVRAYESQECKGDILVFTYVMMHDYCKRKHVEKAMADKGYTANSLDSWVEKGFINVTDDESYYIPEEQATVVTIKDMEKLNEGNPALLYHNSNTPETEDKIVDFMRRCVKDIDSSLLEISTEFIHDEGIGFYVTYNDVDIANALLALIKSDSSETLKAIDFNTAWDRAETNGVMMPNYADYDIIFESQE